MDDHRRRDRALHVGYWLIIAPLIVAVLTLAAMNYLR